MIYKSNGSELEPQQKCCGFFIDTIKVKLKTRILYIFNITGENLFIIRTIEA